MADHASAAQDRALSMFRNWQVQLPGAEGGR